MRRHKAVWGFRIGLALAALLIVAHNATAQGEIRRAPLKTTNGAEYHAGATCPPPTETGTVAGSIYACEDGDFYTFDGDAWIFIGTAGLPATTGAHKVLADTGVSQGWSARPRIGDLTWPASDGMAGQLLATDGSGALGFVDATTGTSDTQILFNDGGSVGGDSGLTWSTANQQMSVFGTANGVPLFVEHDAAAGPATSAFEIESVPGSGVPGFTDIVLGAYAAAHTALIDVSSTLQLVGASKGLNLTLTDTDTSALNVATIAGVDITLTADRALEGTPHQIAGMHVNPIALSNASAQTSVYGLLIDDQTSATATNYAIKTGTGLVAFGDALTVTGAPVTGSDNANPIVLTGGSSVDGQAGNLTFTAGSASGMGANGTITFTAGTPNPTYAGGAITLTTPAGVGSGDITLQTGNSSDADGGVGTVRLTAGAALTGGTAAGNVTLTAGNSVDGAAGAITLTAGEASGMGTDGSVTLTTSTTGLVMENPGAVRLTAASELELNLDWIYVRKDNSNYGWGVTAAGVSRGILIDSAPTLYGVAVATLDTPGTPTVTVVGTTGSTTYGYKIVAKNAQGHSIASTEGTVATGPAGLTPPDDYTHIVWTAVDGAVDYDVYRTTGGATQGKIQANVISELGPFVGREFFLDDQNLGASGAAPSDNTTGTVTIAPLACPSGQTAPLSVNDAGAIIKGSCS